MEWWEDFFDEHWLEGGFDAQDPEAAIREVDFIEDVLSLGKGAKVLDLCCGVGRHAVELARRSFRVVGIDFCQEYIDHARRRAEEEGVEVQFLRRDMRDLPFEGEFDAVVNMWTSFGYFEDEEENQRVLNGVSTALKSGGRFLLELGNRDWIIKNFQPQGWYQVRDGVFVLEDRRFDLSSSRNISTWIFVQGEKRVEKKMTLRLYSLHELMKMLPQAGLQVVAFFGSLGKGELTTDSSRMRIVSRKPEQ